MLNIPSPNKVVVEGKTKIIYEHSPGLALVFSRDNITALDGERRDVIPNKGVMSNDTTCSVFRHLLSRGIPVAFLEQQGSQAFLAKMCEMIPLEIVARRFAYGSYVKRHPNLQPMTKFGEVVVEYFLKTTNFKYGNIYLPWNDPLAHFDGKRMILSGPGGNPDTKITLYSLPVVLHKADLIKQMERVCRETFVILEKAWENEGVILVDLKVEFGLSISGELYLADVIDNDSWRIITMSESGVTHLSKELYRMKAPLHKVAEAYKEVQRMTARFPR